MKFLSVPLLLALAPSFALAQNPATAGYRSLQVDAGQVVGQIRSFQGLNGQPNPAMAGLPDLVQQYKALHVNMVRTHDMMGPADVDAHFEFKGIDLTWLIPDSAQRAGVVEAGNKNIVFPNPNAAPEKPESYNFGPTDTVMAAKPLNRLPELLVGREEGLGFLRVKEDSLIAVMRFVADKAQADPVAVAV